MNLLVGTKTGFVKVEHEGSGNWRVINRGLDGHTVTNLVVRQDHILAGTYNGIFRSDDNGRTWRETSNGLTVRDVCWLIAHPTIPNCTFAGTEPAAIFISYDGGTSWQECPEVGQLRDELGWWVPYSAEAGCVRSFAFSGSRGYAAAEVGGVLRSNDNGVTWDLVEGSKAGARSRGSVHPDVHTVVIHPSSPDLVFAATGGGFYRSEDGGQTWTCLYHCYAHGIWVDPTDPAHMILGPGAGPSGRNGRIEETFDGGQTWHPLTEHWSNKMVGKFIQFDNTLFAVMSNYTVLSANLDTLEWRPVLTDIPGITNLALA